MNKAELIELLSQLDDSEVEALLNKSRGGQTRSSPEVSIPQQNTNPSGGRKCRSEPLRTSGKRPNLFFENFDAENLADADRKIDKLLSKGRKPRKRKPRTKKNNDDGVL